MDGTTKALAAPAELTRQQVDLIKQTVAKDASDLELKLFLNQAQRLGLDPITRQIHFVKRGDRGVIQVGIDGYRLIAERTGVYAGNDDVVFQMAEGHSESDKGARPAKASVTVWKLVQGQRCSFTATARWDEYCPPGNAGPTWNRMPFLMLGKCAEALALRQAFPAELAGTYIHEEMEQADGEPQPAVSQSTRPAAKTQQPKPKFTKEQLWARWQQLWQRAQELGIQAEPLAGNADEATVLERGRKLAEQIRAVQDVDAGGESPPAPEAPAEF